VGVADSSHLSWGDPREQGNLNKSSIGKKKTEQGMTIVTNLHTLG